MSDWDIYRPLGQCWATGRKIEVAEEYFAALVDTEQGFQRRDFSSEAWDKERPQVFCFWKTRMPEPNQKKQIFVDDTVLMTFFDRLGTETASEKVSFRFVLALILMRRRRLKYEATVLDGGHEVWRLRISGQKDTVDVVNPHLDEDQIQQLSSQLGQILQAEF